jgi:hypothetical protein
MCRSCHFRRTRAPNNDAAGGLCVPRKGQDLVVVIGQKKAIHAQDTEAALIVVEGDALGQPGYFIGRGLALQEADSTRLWLRGEVCVGSGVSQLTRALGQAENGLWNRHEPGIAEALHNFLRQRTRWNSSKRLLFLDWRLA